MATPLQIIKAIKKNGYPKIKGEYQVMAENGTRLGAGCAFGQAAWNLKANAATIDTTLHFVYVNVPEDNPYWDSHWAYRLNNDSNRTALNQYIKYLNDDTDMSVTEIGKEAERLYRESKNV